MVDVAIYKHLEKLIILNLICYLLKKTSNKILNFEFSSKIGNIFIESKIKNSAHFEKNKIYC